MCGIAGIYDAQAAPFDRAGRNQLILQMNEAILHRGPDAGGVWHDDRERCSFGHRRLSIIDVSDAGRQPMATADGRWVITFNGEIYNYLELRAQLAAAGVAFSGRTDTEVLLHALERWGIDALSRLDGMFAFAAFDRWSGQLLLARDAFGEKPLYYVELPGGGLAFASELQALELIPGLDLSVSTDAVAELLMFQYVGAPRTIYTKVHKLAPGHWLATYPGQPRRLGRYFRFSPGSMGFDGRRIEDLADELEDILVRSLRRRLQSDVPLGAFLSGGVDSSTVCALIRRKLNVPLKTFSIGFKDAPESEHITARAFAEHLGTEHFDRILAPDAGAFLEGIGSLLDEPNADSSCLPTYLLSGFAREHVTVALSGDGGDEMFCGYGRYFLTLDEDRRGVGKWHPGTAYYSNRILVSVEEHVRELMGEVPAGAQALVDGLRESLERGDVPLHCRLRATDAENYMPGAVLPKVDRMSMRHSLEVRTPFLNIELARFAERLPIEVLYDGRIGKRVLREIAYRYLPRELVDLPKQGFGLPMSTWARESLLNVAGSLLEGGDCRLRRALGGEGVDRFLARQRSQGGFATYQVWAMAMLESWLRHRPAPELKFIAEVDAAATGIESESEVRSQTEPALTIKQTKARSMVNAWMIAPGILVLVDDPRLSLYRRDLDGAYDSHSVNREVLDLAMAVPEVARRLEQCPEGFEAKRFQMPSWSRLGSAFISRGARRALRGAVLLCVRSRPFEDAGWSDYDRLRRLGVVQITFVHPYRGDGAVFSLALRTRGRIRDLADAYKLSQTTKGEDVFEHAVQQGVQDFVCGPLPGTPQLEAEFSHQFMLYEGLRQMPPVPVLQATVRSDGRGRYSIWSRHAYFSKSRTGPSIKWKRWMLERSEQADALLQFVPEIATRRDLKAYFDELSRELSRRPSMEATHPLKSGDRVVVLTHALPPGGAERQWVILADQLRRAGYDVYFVTIAEMNGHNSHYLPLLKASGIPLIELTGIAAQDAFRGLPVDPTARELALDMANPFGAKLPALTAALIRLQPRVVFAQLDYANLLAGVAGALADVPCTVLSFRNYNPSRFSYLNVPWFQDLYRIVAACPAIRLTGNSRAANADYAHWIGIPEDRVAFVPNALEESHLSTSDESASRLRAELGIETGTPVILGVFRLSEEKRPLYFLEICRQVLDRLPRARVLIAGIGPLEAEVAVRIDEMGLQESIQLLGRREDIGDLMSLSSVLLLTSTFEGMPNVVLEAQYMGVPVVASDVGGVRDCVMEEKTGFVIDADDRRGFVEAVTRLLDDETLNRRLGVAAREWARQRFNPPEIAREFVAAANGQRVVPPVTGIPVNLEAA